MKRLFLIIVASIPCVIHSAAPRTQGEFLSAITKAYSEVFNKDNILTEKVSMDANNAINKVFTDLSPIIQKKIYQFNIAFNTLRTINDTIFKCLNSLYENEITPALIDVSKNKSGVKNNNFTSKINRLKINRDAIEDKINELNTSQEEINKLQTALLQNPLFLNDRNKYLTEILNQILITLENILNKIFQDFDRLEAFVTGK